ncbi:cell growth-regulating nucleolar protein isoform X2 [Thalassophryne amazonica]|uniref:cell growth-regulating nucleolar protein isoform X2 n=1 Tax=Thalassophryne amazonica TaxID=390379 RepID=UPI0014726384|nr:cell growth-regulating nucleolar protein isoform X2 [Thalassophryne amazonica]
MVFFTCNACGESLKKAQVDKHVNMCRGCQVLSCIDCGKDFWGDDYKNHVKCISEDQKYGGKAYEAKAKKGDVKQQQWIQRIHEAMNKPGVSAKLRDVLRQVSTYDNVPRKKAKFQNWMRNSLKIANPSLHSEVWDILSATTDCCSDPPPENNQAKTAAVKNVVENGKEKQNGSPEEPDFEEENKKKKLNKQERKEARQQKAGKPKPDTDENQTFTKKTKDRKRKHDCGEDENGELNGNTTDKSSKKKKCVDISEVAREMDLTEEHEEQTASKGKFNWKGTIKVVLRNSPEQEMSVKRLRKKVLAAYYSFTGDGNFKKEAELLAVFNKKINSNPKFRLLKDKVSLVK